MKDNEMNEYLESIGGLENGFYPDIDPIKDSKFFQCGNGWFPLIKDLITDLIELGWDKQVCQVKEKFGALRFYINTGSDEIFKKIHSYENQSYETCETCGEKGELRLVGWYKTLCNKHHEERKPNIQK
jgi:hypothetical protein